MPEDDANSASRSAVAAVVAGGVLLAGVVLFVSMAEPGGMERPPEADRPSLEEPPPSSPPEEPDRSQTPARDVTEEEDRGPGSGDAQYDGSGGDSDAYGEVAFEGHKDERHNDGKGPPPWANGKGGNSGKGK